MSSHVLESIAHICDRMRVRSEADEVRAEPKGGKARGGARGGGRGAARGGRGGCTGQAATKEVDQGGEEEVVEGEGKAAEKIVKAGRAAVRKRPSAAQEGGESLPSQEGAGVSPSQKAKAIAPAGLEAGGLPTPVAAASGSTTPVPGQSEASGLTVGKVTPEKEKAPSKRRSAKAQKEEPPKESSLVERPKEPEKADGKAEEEAEVEDDEDEEGGDEDGSDSSGSSDSDRGKVARAKKTVQKLRETHKTALEKARSATKAAKDKTKEMQDKYKKEKNAFKAWRSRNKDNQLSTGYKVALGIQDPKKREAEIESLMASWSSSHSRAGQGTTTFAHESRSTTTKRTRNRDLDYVECCIEFNLDPAKVESTKALEDFEKLGTLKRIPLKAKALAAAESVTLGGDGRLFAYKRTLVEQVKEATEEDKHTKAIIEKTKSEEGLQDHNIHIDVVIIVSNHTSHSN